MKHQRMYKTLLIFGILSNLFLISCGEGEVDRVFTEVFNYKNATNFLIEIQESKDGVISKYNIQPSESLNYKVLVGTGGSCSVNGVANDNPECVLWSSDYVKIIINSTRYIDFTREANSVFNPLILNNYSVKTNNDVRVYSYTFTKSIYENAEPCNGNCD